ITVRSGSVCSRPAGGFELPHRGRFSPVGRPGGFQPPASRLLRLPPRTTRPRPRAFRKAPEPPQAMAGKRHSGATYRCGIMVSSRPAAVKSGRGQDRARQSARRWRRLRQRPAAGAAAAGVESVYHREPSWPWQDGRPSTASHFQRGGSRLGAPSTQPLKSEQGRMGEHLRWAAARVDAVARELGVALDRGLAPGEAARRLEAHGPNRLAEAPGCSFLQMVGDQVAEPLVLILLGAALLSAVLGEWADVVVILAIVVLNALLGAAQEQRAEASLAALKRMGAPACRVLRDGRVREIPAEELVPGDVILVEAGDRVPADARLVETASLRADESALTGESEPEGKRAEPLDPEKVLGLGDFSNLIFNGTTIAYGRGRAVVYATGMKTALGQIAGLLAAEPQEPTPLQRRMGEVGRTLGAAAGILVLLVFFFGVWRGESVLDMLLMAISLAVAAIPEGLPAVVTIVLALGVQRMAARRAIIRRLPAVETLGTATVIASDKTGTLTLNRMTVTHLVTPAGEMDLSEGAAEAAASAQSGVEV